MIYSSIFGGVAILIFSGFTLFLNRRVRVRTEELGESEATFRKLFEDSSDSILLIDHTGVFVECNQSALNLLKMTRDQFLFIPYTEISPEYQPDGRPSAEAAAAMIDLAYTNGLHRFDWTCINAEEKEFIVAVSLVPIKIKGQTMLHSTWRDITERKQAEEELRKSEAHLHTLVYTIPDLIWLKDKDGVYLSCNSKFERFFGAKQADIVGKTDYDFVDKEFADFSIEHDRLAIAAGKPTSNEEWITFSDNDHSVLLETIKTAMYDDRGELVGILGIGRDITERRRAEEENSKLEVQLQQAQKMEAIGQLAGGVAHDFNNMLGVIVGHTEMAIEEIGTDQPIFHNLKQIQIAADKSTDITRQLLAFARKQTIAPQVIDLNETVESILKMLKRLIGKDVELAWVSFNKLWPVKIDPSQIDQILANLCVNARGAITGVEKIIVETGKNTFDQEYCKAHAGYAPGEYVSLSVSDNGCGMNKETIAHIFEPFFTTKNVGEGTGLGLATVYGAVKQNNGFINVYSEPGQGTTFSIYLPKHHGANEKSRPEKIAKPTIGGKETILLVEDEPTILLMTKSMLQRLGYTVMAAEGPDEAIRLAGEFSYKIDLLITDVIMPEMNGRDLASKILADKANLKCLFMSGYTADIIIKQGVIEDKVSFIQKPFSITDLDVKIREVFGTQ